ncbi:MAG: hypothetical protein HLX46_04730 [Corynebacterium sp.]|uniref:hypothetical protein n=1 Tax=Corynebacterium sp. TaxID=1720 RepID=UPI0017C3FD7D|nr:hypothetical protein [Corynebacterium sp.]NWO16144.1 hypothetical protein [Corynebacterium sp.]
MRHLTTLQAPTSPRGIRIKTVSPNVVEESLDTYGAFFPGFELVRVQSVADALSAPPMA